MTIKKLWMLAAAASMLVGCSADDKTSMPDNGRGSVQLLCSTSSSIASVVTRAGEEFALPESVLPSSDELILTLSGTYTFKDKSNDNALVEATYEWESNGEGTVADYAAENPALEAGVYDAAIHRYSNTYEASVVYGNPDEEGAGKACFEGASAEFHIYPDRAEQVAIKAELVNSCYTLSVSEWMLNYYTDIELTIHTADNDFCFEPDSENLSSELIFVKPGQQLSLSGSATKVQNGVAVTFDKTTIGAAALAARTHYAIEVDHSTAGGGSLIIAFDDTFTEVEAETAELNPDNN